MAGLAAYTDMTDWLAEARRPLLLSHQRPDGDALGALAGMALALRRQGKAPLVALYEPLPPRYGLLAHVVAWREWSRDGATLRGECDSVIILDTCAATQLEPVMDFIREAPRTLVVDHHTTADEIAQRAGDLRLIDARASAASLLVAEWVAAAGIALDIEIATPLFIGIATDCGWFRFSNTDGRTLRMAARLVEAGARPDELHQALYQQARPARLRLITRMLTSLEMHAGERLALLQLRRDDFKAAGAGAGDTEDLINEATGLASTEATLLLTEDSGRVRVNLRSKRYLDVAALARQFGGGGHARAAGARVEGTLDDVRRRVLEAAIAALAAEPAEARHPRGAER